uniref:Activin_recp domain-containing protein n=1 Tax=Strongyloides papillosus TaxID=174720 RepID=A0A0N5CGH1_STREA
MNTILYYRKVINSKNSLKFNFHIPSDEELNPVKCKKYRMTADIPLITPVKSLIEEVKPLIEKAKQLLKAPNKDDLLRSRFFITHRKNNLLQNITSTTTPVSRPPTFYTRPPHIIRDSQVRIGQVQHPINVIPPTTSLNPVKNASTFVSNVKSKLTIFNRPPTTTTVTPKTTTTIRTTTTTRTTPITTTQRQTTDQDNYNVNPPQFSRFQTLDELVKIKIERSVPPISFHSSMEPMFPPNRHHMHGSTTFQQVPTKNILPQPALGIRHKISCTPRGQPTTGTSTFINLCSFCWSWRRLPDGYFPRIINELVCDTDNHCLSGWGTCEQLHRSVDVFRQEANGEWKQVSLQIASCCVCKVQAGSDIHGLVMG